MIELATDTHKLSSFTYNDLFFDIEDSCYAFMKGEHWFLGGYYNERLIAKVNLGGCKIEPEQKVLAVTHVDGFYGSCAVYNDLTHMCFDSNGVGIDRCQTFDGEEGGQAVLPNRSNAPHDYAAMAIYDNKMWVVGGCDTYNDCHNIVESYDGSAWTAAPNIPVERDEIYSQLVLGDVNGLYSISGRYNGRNVRIRFLIFLKFVEGLQIQWKLLDAPRFDVRSAGRCLLLHFRQNRHQRTRIRWRRVNI